MRLALRAGELILRAVEYDRYGPADVLVVREVPAPARSAGMVLVRVAASSVNPKDTFVRKGRFRSRTGTTFPMRTGYDAAGTVLASNNPAFHPGDLVFGMLNGWRGGAAAEVVAWPAEELAPAPRTVPLTDAAAAPLAASTALQALRDHLALRLGQSVLINGASGGVGTFAVQIAKAMGAHVTATCGPDRADYVSSLGAEFVHDYRKGLPDGCFDAVFDVFGNLPAQKVRDITARNGRYVTTVPSPENLRAALMVWRRPRTRIVNVTARAADLALIAQMIDAREVRIVVDGRYPAAEAAEAHRHVERKHTRGKVLLLFGEQPKTA